MLKTAYPGQCDQTPKGEPSRCPDSPLKVYGSRVLPKETEQEIDPQPYYALLWVNWNSEKETD